MEWDKMEWNGIKWNGMDGIKWNGMGWNGMEWNGINWNGMEWDEMEWDSMGSNEIEVDRRVAVKRDQLDDRTEGTRCREQHDRILCGHKRRSREEVTAAMRLTESKRAAP
mmetsp:Transcript_20726/g.43577  ORF Transcript_20726/g.43577 Transcript_20726/m.43577 type:complete len:110 (-) Transcript_20726:161-490(-)